MAASGTMANEYFSDVERVRRGIRRHGLLAAVNRRLGRMNIVAVTVVLLLATLVAALSTHTLLAVFWLDHLHFEHLLLAAVVTVLVGAPVILYAQSVIRELLTSRRALRLMTERLAWALHNAEQANEAKSAFIAAMSHELRTPLNAIIGFSDIMANQRLGPLENIRYRGYATDINASGCHLLEIINDILDIAKIEAGQATVAQDAAVDLAEVVESASTMVGPLAVSGDVALRCRVPAFDVTLVAVERMVRQILVNILSNAIKFTPSGGVVMLDTALLDDGSLAISVTDTGIGMSADDTRTALTPFGQVESAQSRRHAGTGLGLPLAKSMMDLHGGRLTIESAPGEGTTVELLFPPTRVRIGREHDAEPPAMIDSLAAALPPAPHGPAQPLPW